MPNSDTSSVKIQVSQLRVVALHKGTIAQCGYSPVIAEDPHTGACFYLKAEDATVGPPGCLSVDHLCQLEEEEALIRLPRPQQAFPGIVAVYVSEKLLEMVEMRLGEFVHEDVEERPLEWQPLSSRPGMWATCVAERTAIRMCEEWAVALLVHASERLALFLGGSKSRNSGLCEEAERAADMALTVAREPLHRAEAYLSFGAALLHGPIIFISRLTNLYDFIFQVEYPHISRSVFLERISEHAAMLARRGQVSVTEPVAEIPDQVEVNADALDEQRLADEVTKKVRRIRSITDVATRLEEAREVASYYQGLLEASDASSKAGADIDRQIDSLLEKNKNRTRARGVLRYAACEPAFYFDKSFEEDWIHVGCRKAEVSLVRLGKAILALEDKGAEPGPFGRAVRRMYPKQSNGSTLPPQTTP